MRLHLALALLPLHACDPSSDAKNDGRATGIEEESSPLDEDRDGFSAAEGDCDGGNSDVNPGAVELCNGVDDNCDGFADEGYTGVFYADVDGDGFGDPDAARTSCEPAPGFVGQGTDCDDADASRYPGAPETCDDCDGEVDEGLTTVYPADADGDGHGDPATGAPACAAPEGAVATGDDCDDTEPDASPGLEERCDEVDNNCDGATDEEVTSVFYADLDGDGHGDPEQALDACAVPTGYATTDADCDDAAAAVIPDAVELCNGLDDDCDGDLDDPSAADARSWYADADASVATTACYAPAGPAADATN
jgi:hypothetical protein